MDNVEIHIGREDKHDAFVAKHIGGEMLVDVDEDLIGRLPLEAGQLLIERVRILQHRGTIGNVVIGLGGRETAASRRSSAAGMI